ncbi:CLUMA_CG008485, isoform A [Clunio marinus]|uniref:CLUMA_CG008485, isoform A n=1 Tax=Clunio marinus TaxID=568069 RepID=A0A1J1I3T2_9DIPT|nr:CLUMA_CG008485, isoform A [Clunio marinus]
MMSTLPTSNINLFSSNYGQNLLDLTTTMPQKEMSDWAYAATATVLFFIGFFGFSLNLFVIVLMCKDIQIWTPINIILLNLVCSDFSVSIIGNPFTLTSAIYKKWIFGDTICVFYGFFMSLLGITSITTLTVLSYERYCLVSRPFSSSQLTYRGARFAIILIWLYSFALTSPPLFGWGKYINEAANISCSVNWESQTLNATSYIVFLFVFGLVVPVVIIVYSYIRIIQTMRNNAMRSGRVNKVERRVTTMIFVMIIAFLLAWTPYSIFALSEQFGDPELITPSLAVLPALIAKSSICYNPLIYVGMNSQFRAAWIRICQKESAQEAINETTAHQLSEMSSRAYIDCSFPKFDKIKKSQAPKERNIRHENRLGLKKTQLEETLSVKNNKKNVNNNLFKLNRNTSTGMSNEINFSDVKLINFSKEVSNRSENRYEQRMFPTEPNIYGRTINQTLSVNSLQAELF